MNFLKTKADSEFCAAVILANDITGESKVKGQVYAHKGIGETIITDDWLFPCPYYKRECIYVCGSSGSGKSTFVNTYCCLWKKMFPERDIYWFSTLQEDESVKTDVIRIPQSDMVLMKTRPYTIDNIDEGSLVVFDDCDTIEDKLIRERVWDLQNAILQTGRHRNIYCIIISHLLLRPEARRRDIIFTEIRMLVLFPGGGNRAQMIRVLTGKLGVDKKQATELVQRPSRWVAVQCTYPVYQIWDHGISLL